LLDSVHMLHEQNSWLTGVFSLVSQKEKMMQVLERVKVARNELLDEIYAPSVAKKPKEVKEQEAKILKLKKTNDLNRFLEANSDCV
jgi:hypothetical protein